MWGVAITALFNNVVEILGSFSQQSITAALMMPLSRALVKASLSAMAPRAAFMIMGARRRLSRNFSSTR